MSKVIEIPGVGNVEFPASMSDADIGAVIKKQHPNLSASTSATGPNDDRSVSQVAKDQTMAAAKGIVSPFTIPFQQSLSKTLGGLTAAGIAKGAFDSVKAVGSEVIPNVVRNAAALIEASGGPVSPFGAAPGQQENEQAALTAGSTAGGLVVAETLAKAPSLISAAKAKFPTLAKAGTNFKTIMAAAKDIPIDLTEAHAAVDRALELRQRGASLPKVINDFAKNRKQAAASPRALTEGTADPMTYEVGRDFASNASRLSADEASRMAPAMKAQVTKFAKALKEANRAAADSVGMGDLYDAAMKEYRQAKSIEEATATIKKWGIRAAITGAAGAAGYSLVKDLAP